MGAWCVPLTLHTGVQLQRAAILRHPGVIRVCQVDDVGHTPGADDVIVAQQVAALGVHIAGAVRLVGQLATPRDVLHKPARIHAWGGW
jgi:hypothetical protein